jgi:DUF4097 and DUF4098 domain-containing protein YvlB
MKTLIPLAVALVTAAGGVAAQQSINETRPASPTGTVEIHTVSGSVRVIGWNRNEVQVTGTLGRGVERLDFGTEGDRTRIRVVHPREGRNIGDTNLEVRVPVQSSPAVETVSARIDLAGVRGAVDARSVSGAVEVSVEGVPSLQARSVSGQVRLRGASGSVDAESVSGSLDVSVATPQIRAKTVSGALNLRNVSGNAEASTVSGAALVEGDRFSRLAMRSVSGSLRFRGDLERGATVNLNSHSGVLEVSLPARVGAEFDVSTFSGRISNDFGPAAERTGRYTPGSALRFTAGGGGARVSATTFSGNVRLVRH